MGQLGQFISEFLIKLFYLIILLDQSAYKRC